MSNTLGGFFEKQEKTNEDTIPRYSNSKLEAKIIPKRRVLLVDDIGRIEEVPDIEKCSLGRESCDINLKSYPCLESSYSVVSRKHLEIYQTSLGVSVKDLGSKNGTYVNGSRIDDEVFLKNNDILNLGGHYNSFNLQVIIREYNEIE